MAVIVSATSSTTKGYKNVNKNRMTSLLDLSCVSFAAQNRRKENYEYKMKNYHWCGQITNPYIFTASILGLKIEQRVNQTRQTVV